MVQVWLLLQKMMLTAQRAMSVALFHAMVETPATC